MPGNNYDAAKALLEEMASKGLQPDVVTYTCVISVAGHGGLWEAATEVRVSTHSAVGIVIVIGIVFGKINFIKFQLLV